MTTQSQRVLAVTFVCTLAFCIFEFLGAHWSKSLALFADATHMLTDVSALGLAFIASLVASRPSSPRMSYGYSRFEVLSALINGVALLFLSIFIVKEALERFSSTPVIETKMMLIVASIGLLFNIAIGLTLKGFSEENINVRGAFYHVISDALSSVGVILAGITIHVTGWRIVDPILSCFIAAMIIVSAIRLLTEVGQVLLEAAPAHIDCDLLREKVIAVTGVKAVHDLHVWSISTGKEALSAHIEIEDHANHDEALTAVNEVLYQGFKIHHTTLQIETSKQRKKSRPHFHE